MYVIPRAVQENPVRRWALPDRVFFACGACHILTWAFLKAYPKSGFVPVWIKPTPGFPGNHVVAVGNGRAFDYHGYSRFGDLLHHTQEKASRWWEGWRFELVPLPVEALIEPTVARSISGLQLLAPDAFLHDPLARARAFLQRFPEP